jgi:hypothetical protein
MTSSDQANSSAGGIGQQNWRPWQDVIRWRLSRSGTIALLLSPIGLLLISVARLLVVSDYNTVTASAIVSSGGYVNALLGTFIPVVPFLLPYLALVLLFFNRVILAILGILATALISPVAIGRSAAGNLASKDPRRRQIRAGMAEADRTYAMGLPRSGRPPSSPRSS